MQTSRLMTSSELDRYERKWRIIFTVFAIIFVIALLENLIRHPGSAEAVYCYGVGAIAFAGGIYAAKKLRASERLEMDKDGLSPWDRDVFSPINGDD